MAAPTSPPERFSVCYRQFCEGLKIRILRQIAIANRVVPGITRFFQA
jgi:hypothetical protein